MLLNPGDKIRMIKPILEYQDSGYNVLEITVPKGCIAVVQSVETMIENYSQIKDLPDWFIPFHRSSIEEGKSLFVKILELPETIDATDPDTNEQLPVWCAVGDFKWVFPGSFEVIERAG